jgi:hypothetical protein
MTPAEIRVAPVVATWDRERCAFAVTMPDGRVLWAIDETDARRKATAYVGTWQPVRFTDDAIEYPKAAS